MATYRLSKEDWVRQKLATGKYAQSASVKRYLAQPTGKWGTPSPSFVAHQPAAAAAPTFGKRGAGAAQPARPVVQSFGRRQSVGHNGGMKSFDLDSSCLSGGRYDKTTGDLELDFINPSIGTWDYAGVDAQTVRELKQDESPGGYFNEMIRGEYET
jgi:hypothetical protein